MSGFPLNESEKELKEISRVDVTGLNLAVGAAPRNLEAAKILDDLGITHWAHHGRKPLLDEVMSSAAGVKFLLNPTADDGERKPLDWYARSIRFAKDAQENDGSLLITCSRGIHRAPSIAYALLRVLLGMGESDAKAHVYGSVRDCDLRYLAEVDAGIEELMKLTNLEGFQSSQKFRAVESAPRGEVV